MVKCLDSRVPGGKGAGRWCVELIWVDNSLQCRTNVTDWRLVEGAARVPAILDPE